MTPMRMESIQHIEYLAGLLPDMRGKWVLEVGIAGDVKPGGNFYLFRSSPYETLDIDPVYGATYTDDICCPLNVPKSSFDLVILSNTVEHTKDPLQAISGACSLLKPGGYLIVDCPWQYPFHAEDGFGDYWRISHQGMELLLENADMETVKVMPGLITSALARRKDG